MVRNENNCDEPGKVVQLLSVDKDESRIALPKHLFSARESRKMRRSRLPRILITTFVIGLLFTIRPLRAEVHNTLESCVAPFGHDSDDPVVSVTAEFIVSPISGSNHLSITAKIAQDGISTQIRNLRGDRCQRESKSSLSKLSAWWEASTPIPLLIVDSNRLLTTSLLRRITIKLLGVRRSTWPRA